MPITVSDVEKIARLAKLEMNQKNAGRLVHQFQEILNYFALLETVSTESVEPMYYALQQDHPEAVLREDEVRESLPVELVLNNAPDSAEDHFRVPKVIE
ncbi:MAG: Asp-tRNA(Asn)/Glu-tRNA(Gln) amidotransferase subunit GatC [Acidobacteriota bacterium]